MFHPWRVGFGKRKMRVGSGKRKRKRMRGQRIGEDKEENPMITGIAYQKMDADDVDEMITEEEEGEEGQETKDDQMVSVSSPDTQEIIYDCPESHEVSKPKKWGLFSPMYRVGDIYHDGLSPAYEEAIEKYQAEQVPSAISRSSSSSSFIYDSEEDDREEIERLRKAVKIVNYFQKLADNRTMAMYEKLLSDPAKRDTIPPDLKMKIEHVKQEKSKDPNFRISLYDKDMMEFYFEGVAPLHPFSNLDFLRDKESGERILAGALDTFIFQSTNRDEDMVELFIELPPLLEEVMKTYPRRGAIFSRDTRIDMQTNIFNTIMFKLHKKLDPDYIRHLTCFYTNWLEKIILAEEKFRIKTYLWHRRAKGKIISKAALDKAHDKLSIIDEELALVLPLPNEEESWASVPLGERSDLAKLDQKLKEEYQLMLRKIEKLLNYADHLRCKKKLAVELKLWRTTFDELYKEVSAEDKLAGTAMTSTTGSPNA